ncbi:MAG: hypothetical protein PVG89_15100 [Gammaproteobacteria bacterium]|jgi:hypothetical protein
MEKSVEEGGALESHSDASEYGIGFWIDQATELKRAADACWALDTTVVDQVKESEYQGLAKSILQQAAEVNTDLKWLYGNLAAFAIQYLSIGILIDRNNQRFIRQAPGNSIVSLAEECGVELNATQKNFLSQIENAFKWNEKYPKWSVALSRDEFVSLKVKQVTDQTISPHDKKELDQVYNTLRKLALDTAPDSPFAGS